MQTIKAIRTDLNRATLTFRTNVRRDLNRLSERFAVAVMTWLLSKHSVQKVVADTFEGSTPMCRVLREAITNGLEHHDFGDQVTSRDVDRAIEEAFESHDFEETCKDVLNGSDLIKDAIDYEDLIEELCKSGDLAEAAAEKVLEEITRRLSR